MKISVLVLSLALSVGAFAKEPAKASSGPRTLNDSWYTMQAGSTPFGFFHEIIEERDGRYSYRYSLTKYEKNDVFQENIGALANTDLSPIAFNLNKSGGGATETTNATFIPGKNGGGQFAIEVQGARTDSFKRAVTKNTILDVFFPLWLRDNWSKLKPGFRGYVQTFAEDPDRRDFRSRPVRFEVKGRDSENDCLKLKVEMEVVRGDWCMSEAGVLIDLKVGSYHIKRVKNEDEAKAFVAGIAKKAKKSE